ncbi:hypothetical protein BGZ96_011270 [Linnemannia gamsii]|uniref:Uncharacterized protein n=1 Tax=Linnemannia gamsii TaxID=64522 RepID=A0ABQ7JST1_9FUNG|nr:hypothetical protein BGZ96_011270 [Linnemannia gamsii]
MDRLNGIFPVCYTTNGAYIYTAAYDTRMGLSQARVIVAQSKYYPTSLSELTWDAIGEVPQEYMRAAVFERYTYNCAWNNDTATFALLGQSNESMNTTSRFGIEFSTAFSGGVTSPPTKEQKLPFEQFETDSYRPVDAIMEGRSVLISVEGVPGAVVKGDKESGKPWSGGQWIHAQFNVTNQELLLKTFQYNQVFYEAPQVAWKMDTYGPRESAGPIPGTRNYRLLAHSTSNNKLYMVGTQVSNGTLLVTTLPFNPKSFGTRPLTVAQPERYMAVTTESDLGSDCDLDHPWSTASAYGTQLFVLCYPKIESKDNTALRLFSFNGAVFQKVASITTALLNPVSTTYHGPRIVPIPFTSDNPATKTATWSYLSVNFGRRGYVVDLEGLTIDGGLGGTLTIDGRTMTQTFVLDPKNPYLPNDVYGNGTGNISSGSSTRKVLLTAWLGGFFGLLVLVLFAAGMVHRRRTLAKEARRRELIAAGIDPDMNPESAGGVTRTQYGYDASDELPLYTLRAPTVPYMIQQPTDHSAPTITAVGAAIATATVAAAATATATVAATTTTETATVEAAEAATTPTPQTPEPTELPPGYSPDLSRPGSEQNEDTLSVCIDSDGNGEQTAAIVDTAPVANTTPTTTPITTDTTSPSESTLAAAETEVTATPPHPSTTAGDTKTNI